MNARQILTEFAKGTHKDHVIVSPMYAEGLAREMAGLRFDCPQDAPELIDAKIRIGELAGFPPILKHELMGLDLRSPKVEILEDSQERTVKRFRYETPFGPIGWVTTITPESAHSQWEPELTPVEHVRRLRSSVENLSDFRSFRTKVRKLLDFIDDRGLMCINISHPFWNIHADHTELMYLCYDNETLIRETLDFYEGYLKRVIDEAAAEGVVCFFSAQLSKNMLSPDLVRRFIVPQAASLREHCNKMGGIYYLHDCGRMRENIAQGLFNDIAPDWLEGLDASPVGDVDDLKAARHSLSPSIVIKGSLNIEFIQKATPGQIETETLVLLEKTKGFRHIVGGACGLLPGTPIENLKALSSAVKRFLGK